jgi:endonuclease-3 related protein
MLTVANLSALYTDLRRAYGPQHWWPTQVDNPRFEILIGAVLTQHTAWTHAAAAVAALSRAGPLVPRVLLAHENLPELIRTAGTHRVKAGRLRALCNWVIAAGGLAKIDDMATTELRHALRGVHGIGPETADVIALYAFERPAFIADAYAFRLFERYGLWQGKTDYERLRRSVEATAVFDVSAYQEFHALLVDHAKNLCFKQKPDCERCALVACCGYGQAQVC